VGLARHEGGQGKIFWQQKEKQVLKGEERGPDGWGRQVKPWVAGG